MGDGGGVTRGPRLSCAEDVSRDPGLSEISPGVFQSDSGGPAVEAGRGGG